MKLPPSFKVLTTPVSPEYAAMTASAYAGLLNALDTGNVLAIGVESEGKPQGLGLASYSPVQRIGTILSVFVIPELWSKGVGTGILERLESNLRNVGAKQLQISYSTQQTSHLAMERVLQKGHWESPVCHKKLAQISTAKIMEASWLKTIRVSPPFSLFAWKDQTAADQSKLESVRHEITPSLWPFQDREPFDQATSTGLRYQSEVIGWMLTHRVAPNMVRYTSLYVREAWRTPALSFALLVDAIQRQIATLGTDSFGTLAVLADNKPMLRILDRKLKPYATLFHEQRIAVKSLDNSGISDPSQPLK